MDWGEDCLNFENQEDFGKKNQAEFSAVNAACCFLLGILRK
jgi:hypothetical protein